MKLIKAEDNENFFARLVSEDMKIEMGVYPVMFGYRIRAGYVNRMTVELDWCAGANQNDVETFYSTMKHIIETKGTLEGIPTRSEIKPLMLDADFLISIGKLIEGEFENIKLPPVTDFRKILIEKYL